MESSMHTAKISLVDLYPRIQNTSAESVCEELYEDLIQKKFSWVSFVYFAALEMNGWYRGEPDALYAQALARSNYLFADGIAFRLMQYAFMHPEKSRLSLLFQYRKYSRLAVPNLNGTDFLPTFLRFIEERYAEKGGEDVPEVVLYGTYPHILPRAIEYVRKNFNLPVRGAHGYAPFPNEFLS